MHRSYFRLLSVLAALVLPYLAKAEIAAGGCDNPAGYVPLIIAGLEANGVKAEAVPAGIGGHMNVEGNKLMGIGVLQPLGLNAAGLDKAKQKK